MIFLYKNLFIRHLRVSFFFFTCTQCIKSFALKNTQKKKSQQNFFFLNINAIEIAIKKDSGPITPNIKFDLKCNRCHLKIIQKIYYYH